MFDDEVDDPDECRRSLNVGDFETLKTRVMAEMCPTCIFRPGNQMNLRPGALKALVDECLETDGYIVCHSTVPASPYDVPPSICRGFKDRYTTTPLLVAQHVFGFQEVALPNTSDISSDLQEGGRDENPRASGDAA
jgi:hypothetical protein